MSNIIYYFTGTGNSLAITRKLAKSIMGEVKISHIYEWKDFISVQSDEDVIGIVFPVYFGSVPNIVKEFIEKLDVKGNAYLFAVGTCNAGSGQSLYVMEQLIRKKGKKLNAGFTVNMPGNAMVTPNDVIEERLINADDRISEISTYINNRTDKNQKKRYKINTYSKSAAISAFGIVGRNFYISLKNFKLTIQCIGCGIGAEVCPVENISMVNRKPKWEKRCERCLACFHWCPTQAIRIGGPLSNRVRYHHPEIRFEDLMVIKDFK